MVWCNDIVANPDLPSPEGCGWEKKDDSWRPIMTSVQPAPEAIIKLVPCGCKTQCATKRCQCRREGLPGTNLCACSDEEEEPCQNMSNEIVADDDDDDYDDANYSEGASLQVR